MVFAHRFFRVFREENGLGQHQLFVAPGVHDKDLFVVNDRETNALVLILARV